LPREFKVSLGDHLMNERNVTFFSGNCVCTNLTGLNSQGPRIYIRYLMEKLY